MNARAAEAYNRLVVIAWRALAGFLFAFACIAAATPAARADSQTFATGSEPIVWAQIPGQGGITVKTWNRPDVRVDGDPGITIKYFAHVGAHQLPPITFFAATVQTPSGPLTLEPEPFVPPPFDPAGHAAVRVGGSGHATITIPASAPFLVARVRNGAISIQDFHGGTFVAQVGAGSIRLNAVSGTGAVQANFGPVITTNSNFDRLRVRTARGNMFFENCTARQIEATSLLGTIVYDNGEFAPGLARFESERGNIAIGVRGGAQIQAHSASGTVNSEGAVNAGPTVTATSRSGNIVYYNGSIRNHPRLARQLRPGALRRIDGLKRKPQKRPCCRKP